MVEMGQARKAIRFMHDTHFSSWAPPGEESGMEIFYQVVTGQWGPVLGLVCPTNPKAAVSLGWDCTESLASSAEETADIESFQLKAEDIMSVDEVAQLDSMGYLYTQGTTSSLTLTARVLEKLGDDDRAEAYAKRALEHHKRILVLCDAHCILGRIAKRRGEGGPATGHFQVAAQLGWDKQYPVASLKAGRDCGGEAGEAIIVKSLELLGKPRQAFACLNIPGAGGETKGGEGGGDCAGAAAGSKADALVNSMV